jgi:hypothetical protein
MDRAALGMAFIAGGAFLIAVALTFNFSDLFLPRFRDSRFNNFRIGRWFKISTIYGEEGAHSTPYMTRIELGQTRFHIFYRGDADPDPHDHPWDFWTFPLTPYVEEVVERVENKTYRGHGDYDTENTVHRYRQVVPAWRWTFRPAAHCHRVLGRWNGQAILGGGTFQPPTASFGPGNIYTLVRRTGTEREWGFLRNREGKWCWMPWRKYVYEGGKHAPCED